MKHALVLIVMLTGGLLAGAEDAPPATPATAPGDPTLDWLMGQATTAPAPRATPPATARAQSPLQSGTADANRYRQAVLMLSDGEKIRGRFATTLGKPIRVWDEEKKQYRDVPFDLIQSMRSSVVWQRDQEEWKFIASGSDIKERTGKTYPARETIYTVTLVNGQTVTGGVVAPLYLDTPSGDKTFVLNKRSKGSVGQMLKQLVYVEAVEFESAPARSGK